MWGGRWACEHLSLDEYSVCGDNGDGGSGGDGNVHVVNSCGILRLTLIWYTIHGVKLSRLTSSTHH